MPPIVTIVTIPISIDNRLRWPGSPASAMLSFEVFSLVLNYQLQLSRKLMSVVTSLMLMSPSWLQLAASRLMPVASWLNR